VSDEADRIREEYARRASAIPADRYALTATENLLAMQELERRAIAALGRAGVLPLGERRVLDVGCGGGGWLARFESWGAQRERLAGIDLVEDRASDAQARLSGADIRVGDATALPWEDDSFDVVFQSMMFSSILDADVRAAAAAEMARVLAGGGVVLWYDFFVSEPRNPHVLGIGRRELRRLFPGWGLRLRRATLAPPLARAVAPRSRPLAAALTALRVLDTHYVGVLTPR
jgi:ubiquinone/menaquinone biosynthesis C-methylase UbiE